MATDEDNVIIEEDVIGDDDVIGDVVVFGDDDVIGEISDSANLIRTRAEENRLTDAAKTANTLAYILVGVWLSLIVLHFFKYIDISDNSNFEKLETAVLMVIGFYFGRKIV